MKSRFLLAGAFLFFLTEKLHFGFFLIVRSLLMPLLLDAAHLPILSSIDFTTEVLALGGKRQDCACLI
jgi:hypothetical protein